MVGMQIKPVRIKRWMKICGSLAVVLALFFLLLPVGVKYYLIDWLEKNGADSATIETLRFNPFVGGVTLGGVDVQRGGRSILHDASMVLDLGITSLFNHDIRVEKAEYHDLSIDIEQYKDGRWRFGSYTMSGKGKGSAVDTDEKEASAWNFLADRIVLKNCRVHLKTPDLDLTLTIGAAELARFTTRQQQPAGTFTFTGQLNDGPVALQLDTVQIVPELRLGGNISIEGFQLDQFSPLLHDVLPTLAGEVGLKGKLFFSQGAEEGTLVDYDGTVDLAGQNIGSSDFHTEAESLSWKGRVLYTGGPERGPQQINTDGLLAARGFSLQVPASELVMEEARIDLTGKTKVTIAENVLVENDGSLLVEGVKLALPPYMITEASLSWKGKVQHDSDHKGAGMLVRTDGSLNLGAFQVDGGDSPASFTIGGKMASWQGSVGLSTKEQGKQSVLDLNGTLVGGELRGAFAEPQRHFSQEKVELKTVATIGLGEQMDISGRSSFTLQQFTLFEGLNDSPVVSLEQLVVVDMEGRGGERIAVKDVLAEGLMASTSGELPLHVEIPEIKLAEFLTEDLAAFTAGELLVQSPLVTAMHNGKELVRLDNLAARNISFTDGGKVGAENVQLQEFALLGTSDDLVKKPAVSFGSATLGEISWSAEAGLQGNTLQFDDFVATVIRDKDGHIDISRQLAEMQQAAPAEEAAEVQQTAQSVAKTESQSTSVKLQKIIVTGKSSVFFKDYTLRVPYVSDLAFSRLELTGLDSSRPDQKTEVLFQGELEKRAPVKIAGYIFPFKKKPGVDMQLDLKNYPLSSLSAYTVQSVGTALASGQLQLQSKIVLANDKLDMNNAVLLKKLETKTISPELAGELNNQLPIPLDAALSILRDNKQNISLNIPVRGPVSELSVGISDIMITALGKAIVPAASGYLMYALGPYGALAYVGMKVGEKMLVVQLPPVVFEQQATSLTTEHAEYLQRIGKILQERPNADIQLCPQVASWEFMTEQEKTGIKGDVITVNAQRQKDLLALGQQRAVAVQGLLEKNYGIARNRLLICDTKIHTEKNAVPAVLLQL